ncbi:ArsR family transcriptional regulator [Lactobacillus sp. XV13L]|nr:ArsR family transcriptional regulator [Lactobacillus sp. XV13L]
MNKSISEIDENRVKVFKALADPLRLKIIKYLDSHKDGVTCNEINDYLNISKSSGSYHFKILRDANLTLTRKNSREKYVSLNYSTFSKYVKNIPECL